MSALPPKADIDRRYDIVRFVPKSRHYAVQQFDAVPTAVDADQEADLIIRRRHNRLSKIGQLRPSSSYVAFTYAHTSATGDSSEWPNRRRSPRRTPRLFRQPGLAQALGPAGEVFRPPIRPQYKSQIGNAQRGIELPQPRQGFLCLLRPPGKPVACSGDAQYIDEIGAVP